MRFHALACDYDGTLAHDGRVARATVTALERARESGRRLILVTGRELGELHEVFPQLRLFDRVVAENGALLYTPATRRERPLAQPPPAALIARLRAAGAAPLSVGRVIVATREPYETAALAAIRDLGLEREIIFNKGAVMVLPSGITKATGLAPALAELGLSPHNVVAVGDAENDHHLLRVCECGVAVANAVPSLKDEADWVTARDHGTGVVELIEHLIASDLAELAPRLARHAIPIGRAGASERHVDVYGPNLLLAGQSGGGKSTFATGFVERLLERGYQYCVIDPEGDYGDLGGVVFGDAEQPPRLEPVLELLEDPRESCVVNLIALPLEDRPRLFARLFAGLLDLRARTGRPHWIVVDEAHHMLSPAQHGTENLLGSGLRSVLWITLHPDRVAREVLRLIDTVIAVGDSVDDTFARLARALGQAAPAVPAVRLTPGEAVWWCPGGGDGPERIATLAPRMERRRHRRKYAEGELEPERSFYFRGPEGKLNLRAQNLSVFLQSAEGVDADTWLYHLRRGDYSRWFRETIKDDSLADAVQRIERADDASAGETRAQVRREIERRYAPPA